MFVSGRDRLANREEPRMEVGAVAEILEHVRRFREHRMRRPVDAFAAHLDQALGIALHPRRHEVAADARLRDRALGHFGRCVVRTARAEVRRALDGIGGVRQDLRRDEIDHEIAAIERGLCRASQSAKSRISARRAQFAQRAQQRPPARRLLADDARPRRSVVQVVLDLLLDHPAFSSITRISARPSTKVSRRVVSSGNDRPTL